MLLGEFYDGNFEIKKRLEFDCLNVLAYVKTSFLQGNENELMCFMQFAQFMLRKLKDSCALFQTLLLKRQGGWYLSAEVIQLTHIFNNIL